MGPKSRNPRATTPPAALPNPNDLLSVSDAARQCGLGKNTVWERVRRGEIPSRRVGVRVLIRRGDLDAYIESLPPAFET